MQECKQIMCFNNVMYYIDLGTDINKQMRGQCNLKKDPTKLFTYLYLCVDEELFPLFFASLFQQYLPFLHPQVLQ